MGAWYASAHAAPTESIDRKLFLDSVVSLPDGGGSVSLIDVIDKDFIRPILNNMSRLRKGRALPDDVPTSAILFGPPGTSKTKLAGLVAQALGWRLLKLDPSHLTRNGLDALHAEANKIFGMLEAAEEIVVLLDEFDELVRDRDEQGSESASRFLTTAMLPKLAALSERRRLVYLIATNHLEHFDAAIAREGRFDMIMPVMPPSADAKLAHLLWAPVAASIRAIGREALDAQESKWYAMVEDFTFGEFKQLAPKLAAAASAKVFTDSVVRAHSRCTLEQMIAGSAPLPRNVSEPIEAISGTTWKERLLSERGKVRLPGVA